MSAELVGLANELSEKVEYADRNSEWAKGANYARADAAKRIRALAARLPDGPAIQPLGPRHYTEQDVRQALSELQREFEQRAAPFLKVLCDIEARKPPRPFFIAAAPTGGQHGK